MLNVVHHVRALERGGTALPRLVQRDGANDDASEGDDEANRRERLRGANFLCGHASRAETVHVRHQIGVARAGEFRLDVAVDVIRFVVLAEFGVGETKHALQVGDGGAIVVVGPPTARGRGTWALSLIHI